MILVNIVVDLIFVLILVIGLLVGIKRGFVNTLAKPVKLVLAFVLAFSLASTVGSTLLEPLISAPVTSRLSEFLNENFGAVTAETVNTLPTVIKFAAGLCEVDMAEVAASAEGDVIAAILNEITQPVVDIVCNVIAFVLVFIVALIVLGILLAIVNAIVDNGIIGVFNRILGAVFTLAFCILICWGLAIVLEYASSLPALQNVSWIAEFTGGYVYRFFRSFSPLDVILSF